jgi:[ribosomal protein S18]-alanine N-acetyltransferase
VATVRVAKRDDLDAVMRLQVQTPEVAQWGQGVYESFLVEDHGFKKLFIAEETGKLVGFAVGQVVADACELESIVVERSVRRAGVGRALLAALVEWAQAYSAISVELEVRSQNHSAISFYERFGFRSDGLRRSYYQNPADDAVLMSLPLGGGSRTVENFSGKTH